MEVLVNKQLSERTRNAHHTNGHEAPRGIGIEVVYVLAM